jgi:hypothetical protein
MFGQDNEWVKDLKVGDAVVVQGYDYGKTSYRVVSVQKVTPQQIHVGDKPEGPLTKFWKKDASQVGGSSWHRVDLVKATPELLEKVKAIKLRGGLLAELRRVNWNELSTETLQAVFALVKITK